jgi:hypothetical protein
MNQRDHWVRIAAQGEYRGAGFRVTQGFVLTAMHCLRKLSSEDLLDLELPDGRVIPGRLRSSLSKVDLALVAVEGVSSRQLSLAAATDWPRPDTRWSGTYSPPEEYKPLSGRVTHAALRYRSREGGYFEGIQLTVEQDFGDFSGYSGSPLSTDPGFLAQPLAALLRERPVVGILMEQQYSRAEPSRPTNVLIAASVQYAMGVFPEFSTGRLRDRLRNLRRARQPSLGTTEYASSESVVVSENGSVGGADGLLKSLRQWEDPGLMTSADADARRSPTVHHLGDHAGAGSPDA